MCKEREWKTTLTSCKDKSRLAAFAEEKLRFVISLIKPFLALVIYIIA